MILGHLKLRTDIALLQETHLPEIDFHRMNKQWVGEVVGLPALGRKAGVLILLRKGLRVKILDVEGDEAGRRATILLEENGVQIRITNIYAPNSPSIAYFQELSSWIAQKPQKHLFCWRFQLHNLGH